MWNLESVQRENTASRMGLWWVRGGAGVVVEGGVEGGLETPSQRGHCMTGFALAAAVVFGT